jgi:hypothetical protein
MKETFLLTRDPASKVGEGVWTQNLATAVDVSKYDSIDLQLVVANYVGGGIQVRIFTGNTLEPNDAFVLLVAFPTVLTPQATYKVSGVTSYQRFVYWKVPVYLSQPNNPATIYIVGTGYKSSDGCCRS